MKNSTLRVDSFTIIAKVVRFGLLISAYPSLPQLIPALLELWSCALSLFPGLPLPAAFSLPPASLTGSDQRNGGVRLRFSQAEVGEAEVSRASQAYDFSYYDK